MPRLLPVRYGALLLIVGALTAVGVFWVDRSIPPPRYHLGREAELRGEVETYLDHHHFFVRAVETDHGTVLAPAGWDDDPGSYAAISVTARLIDGRDAYRAAGVLIAALAAVPWLWIPLAFGVIFGSLRAGIGALAALPAAALMALPRIQPFGTDYGAPVANGVPVYALYGIASEWIVIAVTFEVLLWSLARWRAPAAVVLAAAAGIAAGIGDFIRSSSGIAIVGAGVVLLMALGAPLLWRAACSAAAVVTMLLTNVAETQLVIAERLRATGVRAADLPTAHNTWHPLYLGLSYVPWGRHASPFGIAWDDDFGLRKAREVDPHVALGSTHYDSIIRGLYLQVLRAHPAEVLLLYVLKAVDTAYQERLYIAAVLLPLGAIAVLTRRRPTMGRVAVPLLAALVPGIVYGLVPPTLVYPLRYYFVELTACLSLALLVGLCWVAAEWDRRRSPLADDVRLAVGGRGRGGPPSARHRKPAADEVFDDQLRR